MKLVDSGAEKKQSMVCPGWLHNSILISNFLHFDDRKNPSQFRQKMNVYGLVRPQVLILKSWPIGSEHLRISTNDRRGPVTMPSQCWVRWGPVLAITLPQTTQTQFLMESGWCYVGNVGLIIIPQEHDLIRKKPHIYPWNRPFSPYPSGSLGDQKVE